MFYLLANISSLANVKWYLGMYVSLRLWQKSYVSIGVPMKDIDDLRLEIVQYGQQFLGDNLLGIQVGNEPDLYERFVGLSYDSFVFLPRSNQTFSTPRSL